MHCWLVNNSSPRRASPGIMPAASALQPTSAPTGITRSMNIAGLLFTHSEAGHESVRPEPFVQVHLFAVPIPPPLGDPLYVLVDWYGEASERLVIARGSRARGDEQRSAGGEFRRMARHDLRQYDIDGRSGDMR